MNKLSADGHEREMKGEGTMYDAGQRRAGNVPSSSSFLVKLEKGKLSHVPSTILESPERRWGRPARQDNEKQYGHSWRTETQLQLQSTPIN